MKSSPRLVAVPLAMLSSSGALAQITFTDQTQAAGLVMTHTCPASLILCDLMGGAGIGDFDRDGWPDVFVPGGGETPDRLFINKRDGTFSDEALAWGVARTHVGGAVAVGDYDRDGWQDLFVTSLGPAQQVGPGQNLLYHNTGLGTFDEVAFRAEVDVTSPVIADGVGAVWGDYDLDGDLDLAVTAWRSSPQPSLGNRLFENYPLGYFRDVTNTLVKIPGSLLGFTPVFADLDDDRYPELLFVGDRTSSRYYRNDAGVRYEDLTGKTGTGLDNNGMGSVVADLDNDGRFDWMVTSIFDANASGAIVGDGNKLYRNVGLHKFREVGTRAGVDDGGFAWGIVAVDLDHDGLQDLVNTNGFVPQGYVDPTIVWKNEGGMSFRDVTVASGLQHSADGRGLAAFDYDRDGDQDVLVLSNRAAPRLYRNELSGPATNWIVLRLDSSTRARLAPDGIGSRVRIRTSSGEQHRLVTTGPSYQTTVQPVVHFGIGADPHVAEVEVRWTDGAISRFVNVPANREYWIQAP